MRIGLFIPCYIDQLYPQVAVATLELLEKLGCDVVYPTGQTCCGQPLANAGFNRLTGDCEAHFRRQFEGFDVVVAPSGSCVAHVKEQYGWHEGIYELSEFLTDILKVKHLDATFPHQVGWHEGCHGLRMLALGSMSEQMTQAVFSKPKQLLHKVKGLELVTLERTDECCGFGGTFCVGEAAVSVKMGKDRVADHLAAGAEFLVGADMSCLMHLEGILRRQGSTVKVLHLAQVLNGGPYGMQNAE